MNPGRAKVEGEGRCRVCGTGPASRLEAAHLWPRSMGAKGFENADLIVPLCGDVFGHGCHSLFDAHGLDLLPYLSIDEQVALVRAAGGIERARNRAIGRNPSDRCAYLGSDGQSFKR